MTEELFASVANSASAERFAWVRIATRVLPVCAFSEFLFKGPDDDLLHPLIGLGDEIYSGAFCHDPYFALPSSSDFLNEWNIIGTSLVIY